jgi:hypothetical protein
MQAGLTSTQQTQTQHAETTIQAPRVVEVSVDGGAGPEPV